MDTTAHNDQQPQEQSSSWNSVLGTPSTSLLRSRQGHASTLTESATGPNSGLPQGASSANRLHAGAIGTTLQHKEKEEQDSTGRQTEQGPQEDIDSLTETVVSATVSAALAGGPEEVVEAAGGAVAVPAAAHLESSVVGSTVVSATTTEMHEKEVLQQPSTGTDLMDSDANAEFSCNICFDTSISPVLTLCGHLFCWSCLHQWLDAQRQNPTCPVCKAGCAQDKVIPIYGRGKEHVDPRSTTPKRPAGQRPEPFRNPNQTGFTLGTGQVTFTGTMIPPFMFSPFGIQYGASYTGNMGTNGAVQTPMQAYVSRMFFMLGTLILVGILLY
ncbi:hypothetical protein BC939DRAFT_445998 [Gamsiella multidivaricata]|uniref:uncharacterized protein n=1 Tax=Gamsiella multidivaricata TaxID=101098 RepID=UPI00222080FB|nr:uncharacterized protein BC939DRAFT_445998 [Gamsiella multidivaricata]KAI7827184.1 hypothetical protein BC939DRAFT_445998 [Gamsiella multidivaricata]